MPSRPISQGRPKGVFSAPNPAGMNGPGRSEALRSALGKIDRIMSAIRLRFPTASEDLRHWRDGGGRDRILSTGVFQSNLFLLDHLRDSHRPKLVNGTKRRLISGELVPDRGGVETECTDLVKAPQFTDLFFALGEFTVHSRVEATVTRSDGQLVLRLDNWRVEISADYDWDPGTWALVPGIGRVTFEDMLALQMAGHARRYHIRSESATITDPEVTAPTTLPAGNF